VPASFTGMVRLITWSCACTRPITASDASASSRSASSGAARRQPRADFRAARVSRRSYREES
jgi:hypothetical protein